MSNSTPPSDNENDKNKLKVDESQPCPSRVLHLRQVPDDVTEAEIIALGLPFGKVTNLLLLRGKSQALLEMATEEAAKTMLSYYTLSTPVLRCHPVYIQYSNHKELNTDNLPNNAKTQATLEALNATQSEGAGAAGAEDGNDIHSVLWVSVENPVYPITLEVLFQVFSRFGTVLKIVTYCRNNQLKALLQYADPMNAYSAKLALDGQNIYTSCCTLHIGFSKLTSLRVKYNNERSRDFTRFDLPSGAGPSSMVSPILSPFGKAVEGHVSTYTSYVVTSGHSFDEELEDKTGAQNTFFPPSSVVTGFAPAMPYGQDTGLPFQSHSGPLPVPSSAGPGQRHMPGVGDVLVNRVLLVTNLNTEAITPHGLFILFGLYGDVYRVKIMFKKKGNALIQMADANQAQIAMNQLNGQRVYGKILYAKLSKHQIVWLPREGQEGHGLTKDYTNSPLHRFRRSNFKYFQNIIPPSDTLHLANVPLSVTADDLKKLFEGTGSTVKAFKYFEEHNKMAFIQLGSVEEAIQALMELHHHDFGENNHLRISFSKYAL